MLCCMALAVMVGLSGCSALDGAAPEPNPCQTSARPGDLEKTSIKVAFPATVDLAAFWLAQDACYFKAEGLDVENLVAENGFVAQTKVISGEADLGLTTLTLLFVAQQSGAANLRLVADGTSASPKSNALITVPQSPVKSVNDLAGKRIAYTSKNAASDILTRSLMADHGVDYSHVQWSQVPMPNMAAALADRQVDAAYVAEPFLTQAAKKVGATPIIDVASGSSVNFPITGWGAKAEWTQQYPHTMAAFQRAMFKATRAAVADRAKIEPLVEKYAKVDADTAKLMTLPGFGSTLDATRIQRVPDRLWQLGVIPSTVDAASMIVKQPTQDPPR